MADPCDFVKLMCSRRRVRLLVSSDSGCKRSKHCGQTQLSREPFSAGARRVESPTAPQHLSNVHGFPRDKRVELKGFRAFRSRSAGP